MIEPPVSRWEPWCRRLRRLRTHSRSALLFAAGIVAAFTALLTYNALHPAPHQLTAREVNAVVAQAMASATPPPAFSAQVYQIILPSLVLIESKGPGSGGKPLGGVGSGIVVDDAGDILTALHVVTGANDIQLTFADGAQSAAQVITRQPQNDIAVLKADKPPAQIVPATLGNPRAMRVGDEAYVVGNPLGLYGSMSAGVISAFDRSFKPPDGGPRLTGLIQFDAAANPGNSGGPLLNRYGQVVGIVTALVNPTGQDVFIGIGFAVPINIAGGAAGLPPD